VRIAARVGVGGRTVHHTGVWTPTLYSLRVVEMLMNTIKRGK
jgi:hypothetical protein